MRRPWALPLVPLYTLAAAAHQAAYRLHLRRAQALTAPVISVGSLSAGGAGKTPVVLMLARVLAQQGFAVDVLTRGYRRSGTGVEQVELTAHDAATRFGDEPVELAAAGLRVFVGQDRAAAGRLAESCATPGPPLIHLLDDGFQHFHLMRQLDLVLLTSEDLTDRLLPAGNLREPLRAVRRAQIVLLREEEADDLTEDVRAWSDAPIWRIRRHLTLPPDAPARPFAFCGIARPEGFFTMLQAAGTDPAGRLAFPDHHAYTPPDLDRLLNAARACGADGFLTTAKDAVKLTPTMRARLYAVGPVITASLTVSLDQQSHDHLTAILRQIERAP